MFPLHKTLVQLHLHHTALIHLQQPLNLIHQSSIKTVHANALAMHQHRGPVLQSVKNAMFPLRKTFLPLHLHHTALIHLQQSLLIHHHRLHTKQTSSLILYALCKRNTFPNCCHYSKIDTHNASVPKSYN